MATSGSFTTTSYSNRNLVFSWSLQSQSIADNTSTISWTLKGGGSASGYYLTQNITLTVNGTTVYSTGQTPQIKLWNGTTVASGTATIAHNNDGTKTFSASCTAGIYEWSPNVSGSGSWTLDTIPRYATVSQSLQSKTETTAVMKWTADSTIDYIWYSKNNGSSWTGIDVADGTSGTYTISSLTANTTYQIKTRVRRKDSQLTTDSSALSVTTYNYPYCTNMPSFNIGSPVTLTFYNPLGRTFTFYIIGNGTQISNNWTISGTTYTGIDATSSQTQLYSTIPSATQATYQVKCVYGSSTITRTGGVYKAVEADCKPTIGSVTYKDTATGIVNLTGNDQKIVRNKSTVRYTATGLAGNKSATISSCSVSVNGLSYAMTISGTSATGGNASIDSGTNVTAKVTVTDSRGYTNSKSVTVTMLDYSNPTGIITMHRHDNYYSETDITVDASFSYVDGTNSITMSYQYKKTGTSTWSSQTTLQDNVTSTFTADNAYAWDVKVIITDVYGGQTVYNLVLSRGMPIIFFDRIKSSVGVNCFPKDNNSLELNGYTLCKNIMTRGLETATSNLTLSSYTKLPLDCVISYVGDKLTVPTTDNGGITIGANVTKVLVSGQMTFQTGSYTGNRYFRIVKNAPYNYLNTLGWGYMYMNASSRGLLVIPPMLADVTAGDVIYLMYYTANSGDSIDGGSSSKWLTALTVEVVC